MGKSLLGILLSPTTGKSVTKGMSKVPVGIRLGFRLRQRTYHVAFRVVRCEIQTGFLHLFTNRDSRALIFSPLRSITESA